jgi:predicted peptidase
LEVLVRFTSLFALSLLAVWLAFPSRSAARNRETGFLDRTISVGGASYKYQVFLPDDWSPKQKWPIILFLHGAGERGSDGLLETDVGLPHAVRLDRSRFQTIIVIPQCLKDHWWTQAEMEALAFGALTAATKEFKGDPKRTYLTGLSMGGYGSWDLASKYPGKFAAVVPICGGITLPEHFRQQHPEMAKNAYPDEPQSYADFARKIGKTPVWIFHGGADDTVSVEYSRKLNDALKAAGGNVRYTEYAGVGHNSWDKAYAEPDLVPWLLSQSL